MGQHEFIYTDDILNSLDFIVKNSKSIEEVFEKINYTKITKYSSKNLKAKLRKLNINYTHLNKGCRIFNFREDYFNIIDTEDKAYWLGFIAADGCVCKKSLVITVAEIDKEHLVKFLNYIEYKGKITKIINKITNKIYYSINIYSGILINGLKQNGVCERKSLVLKPWKCESKELLRHYWRGLFDGDGGIYKRNNKNKIHKDAISWRSSLTGTYEIVEEFSRFIYFNSPSEKRISTIRRHGTSKNPIYVVSHDLRSTKNLCNLLYKESSIYLDRKMELALIVMKREYLINRDY